MQRKRTGIILAWDKSEYNDKEDTTLIKSLMPYIDGIKIGLEAMNAESNFCDYDTVADIVASRAAEMGLKIMWDAKLHDIGNTVAKAVNGILRRPGISMLTLHAAMSDEALSTAGAVCREKDILALAVSLLTDISPKQCRRRFRCEPEEAVRDFAEIAFENGIRGLVCSPKELSLVRSSLQIGTMTTVIPGIRPEWASLGDQKRIATPRQAALDGADYIVVGRPIMNPPMDVGGPVAAAMRIRTELDEAFTADHQPV
jgi:orotidine-5'-phosphate decarboxylase